MTTSASCARSSLSADVRRPHGEREDEPRAALGPILDPDVTALAAHELATSTWPGARLERATAIRRVERSGQNLRALSIRLPRICRKRSASARTRGTSAATVSTRRRDPRCAVRAAATMMSSTTRLIRRARERAATCHDIRARRGVRCRGVCVPPRDAAAAAARRRMARPSGRKHAWSTIRPHGMRSQRVRNHASQHALRETACAFPS